MVIRNYWEAVNGRSLMNGRGPRTTCCSRTSLSMSILGGTFIDRCMARATGSVDGMARYLRQAKPAFDWNKDAAGERSVSGMSGNRAALINNFVAPLSHGGRCARRRSPGSAAPHE
jgi:hypothetical protein